MELAIFFIHQSYQDVHQEMGPSADQLQVLKMPDPPRTCTNPKFYVNQCILFGLRVNLLYMEIELKRCPECHFTSLAA